MMGENACSSSGRSCPLPMDGGLDDFDISHWELEKLMEHPFPLLDEQKISSDHLLVPGLPPQPRNAKDGLSQSSITMSNRSPGVPDSQAAPSRNKSKETDLILVVATPKIRSSPKTSTTQEPSNDSRVQVQMMKRVGDAEKASRADDGRGTSVVKLELEESKKATNATRDTILLDEIKDDDVVCERGGRSNAHKGNRRYRALIMEYRCKYQSAKTKSDKTNISQSLVDEIHSRGGRFLKRVDPASGILKYQPIPSAEARLKTSQALRERKALKLTTG